MSSRPTPVYDALSRVLPYLFPPSIRATLLDGTSPLLSWQPARTPFSTPAAVLMAGAAYLSIIFIVREWMLRHNVPAFSLRKPFVLHNLLLSTASFLLLACMLEEIVPIWWNNGFFHAICAQDAWTPRMETLYIFNYLFKYWELGDTMFLVLKKKPLAFLHVYHHSATALLCFSQLLGKTSVSWVVICLNLAVHVVMYFYYLLAALRIRVPWKKAVTTMQISQFVLDLGVVYFASYSYFVSAYHMPLPNMGSCAAGKEHAVWSGCAILTSYLFLFIAFYQRTYHQRAQEGSKPKFMRTLRASSKSMTRTDIVHPELRVPSVPASRSATPDWEKVVEQREKAQQQQQQQ